jgi:hypothetical protein
VLTALHLTLCDCRSMVDISAACLSKGAAQQQVVQLSQPSLLGLMMDFVRYGYGNNRYLLKLHPFLARYAWQHACVLACHLTFGHVCRLTALTQAALPPATVANLSLLRDCVQTVISSQQSAAQDGAEVVPPQAQGPSRPSDASVSSASSGQQLRDWGSAQAAALAGLRAPWNRGVWCSNALCCNLTGTSELLLPTFACGEGCSARYCGRNCQEQAWREGHRHTRA